MLQPLASSHPHDSARKTLLIERTGLEALSSALNNQLGASFDAAVEAIFNCSGRLAVTGIGKSGHIGRKIQATLASTGTPSLFIHPAEAAHGDLGMLAEGDLILALSNSGETSELAAILTYASRRSIRVIAITAVEDSALARAANITLLLPRAPEACPMGLAPTTSTLMQLALGDALAIALLERRNFTAEDFGTFHPGGRLGAQLRPVRELMHSGDTLPLGKPELPLQEVILEMTRKTFGCMGVIDHEGALCGLITDADLRHALLGNMQTTTARDVMNTKPITTTPKTLAQDALRQMNARTKPVTSLFVLNDDRQPVGIIHLHDLLRAGLR
ncbi:arabinose-5-phosphate isomerase GutQ [Neokomagataea thailandica NBRC 106555]|uniref:KpsF/GutQ family sugar-phosphate isomerase n=2 Tax=Neokomagataea TaxID=1223423 RepID=A0A4Y6V8Z2_9PROT|nr:MULTISPECIES: KpsF/GutQ family sugar-phosphate isomerase [Neokomagataea]QDH25130.1 KpsF/GutQ family sugar-phosphate isomerase [Neokomagataea tanensis]GBR52069.1 arabinose-5-phosphate isomerase GutQ [Neokomagataea thailandica NBRC 106555]